MANDQQQDLESEIFHFYERPITQMEKTESYLKHLYGSGVKGIKKSRNTAKFEKFIVLIVLVVLLAALISWGVISYNHTQKINSENIKKINNLDLKFQLLAQKFQSLRNVAPEISKDVPNQSPELANEAARSKKSGVSKQETSGTKMNKMVMKLIGDNSDFESRTGEAIRSWDKTHYMQKGSISLVYGKYIQVGKAGLYMIQARMFFKDNNRADKSTLSYSISKWSRNPNKNNNLAVASIPTSSCHSCCSLSISEVVLLQANDRIFLETPESGLKFRMAPDKSSFSCYLLI